MYGTNTVEQDNINFLLNKYKDIIRNDDGTFRLEHRCIPGDTNNSVHFVNTGVHNHNELEHNCYRCKHCEPEDRACHDRCLLRTRLENSSIKLFANSVANCDAYDPIECLNIIHDMNEMVDFMEMVEKYFNCHESLEEYFGFTPNANDDTGKVLETIREYHERGGEFTNVPDKYPCVIYFPIDDIDIRKKLEWIYIGKVCL